jgi:hypothetical protein
VITVPRLEVAKRKPAAAVHAAETPNSGGNRTEQSA